MKDTKLTLFSITNWERRFLVNTFLESLGFYTYKSKIVVVENGVQDQEQPLKPWLNKNHKIKKFRYLKVKKQKGLSKVWNICLEKSRTDWNIICNDDCIVTKPWEDYVEFLTTKYSPNGERVLLLCHPNGFSGFAIHKNFWEKYGHFNNDFPEGYYEDDDFFLKVAHKENLHTKAEIMEKCFFSLYDNFNESIFKHAPNQSFFPLKKWNRQKNKVIFDKYWKEVNIGTEHAIENKNGKFFTRKENS